ncbi:MAG: D-alanine--D-alanine ligase [Bacilli bacterium]|nr:D-alanine--D-alanine ligase [Bacilli bacterium]
MKIKLGVIFGGESVEHEVSIISALQAMEHLNAEKYDIIPIYISKDRTFYCGKMLMDMDVFKNFDDLKKYAKKVTFVKKGDKFFLQKVDGLFRKDITDIDIVLPIVHGNNVEDGSIQGYLDSIGIPYVGSKVLGSALGQDKVVMKQVFASAKLPIVDYTWFYDNEYSESKEEILKNIQNLGYPVVVKPATLGSSVGITYVEAEEKVRSAIEEAIKYDKKIIVEKAVDNLMEVNCSVLGNYMYQEVSALEEVMSEHNLLTYADKYIGGSKGKLKGGFKRSGSKGMASASRVIPARISSDLETEIKDLSKKVFNVLNLSGLCRIDYLIDKKANKVYVNEPNTIPGSLAFYLWEPIGKSYDQLLDDMINLSIKEYKQKLKKTYSFDTNILSNYNGIKGAKGKLKR